MEVKFSFVFDRQKRIKDPKNDTGLIQLCAYQNAKRKFFSTGIKVLTSEWYEEKEIVIKNALVDSFNLTLNEMMKKANTAQLKAKIENVPFTLQNVCELFTEKREKINSFIDFIKLHIKTGAKFKPATIRSKETTLRNLLKFTKDKDVLFNELDVNFFKNYENYCYKKGLKQNTVRKQIKTLKAFINDAIGRGFYKKDNPCNKIKIKEIEKPILALTQMQLNQLENLEFEIHENKLILIKDMFLFQCYTGLRLSDLKNVKSNDIKKNNEGIVLEFTAIKTEKPHILPLYAMFKNEKGNSKPVELAKKYIKQNNEALFKTYCEQKYNRELKIIGNKLKLDFPLTSHIGRKTCATLLSFHGLNEFDIKFTMQHKDIKTTMKYVQTNLKSVTAKFDKAKWN